MKIVAVAVLSLVVLTAWATTTGTLVSSTPSVSAGGTTGYTCVYRTIYGMTQVFMRNTCPGTMDFD